MSWYADNRLAGRWVGRDRRTDARLYPGAGVPQASGPAGSARQHPQGDTGVAQIQRASGPMVADPTADRGPAAVEEWRCDEQITAVAVNLETLLVFLCRYTTQGPPRR